MVVRFEDLVGASGGGCDKVRDRTIQEVCSFLNVCHSTIDLKKLGAGLFGGTQTFRSGRIDAWRVALSPSLTDEVQRHLGDRILAWGYQCD
jgi:hypothetical protein